MDDNDDMDDEELPPDPEDDVMLWRQLKSSSGKVYYYNEVTRKRQWKPPACWNDRIHTPSPPPEDDDSATMVQSRTNPVDVVAVAARLEEARRLAEEQAARAKLEWEQERQRQQQQMLADLQAATRQLHEEERARRLAEEQQRKEEEEGRRKAEEDRRQAELAAKLEAERQQQAEQEAAAAQANASSGPALDVICPHCSAKNVSGARFCAECGHGLMEAPTVCQRGKCGSKGLERKATQVTHDRTLKELNHGQPFYVCRRCAMLLSSVQDVRFVPLPGEQSLDDYEEAMSVTSRMLESMYMPTGNTSAWNHPMGLSPQADNFSTAGTDDVAYPPGPFLHGQPDMTSDINQQWYESNDIFPEDPRWGKRLNVQLEVVDDSRSIATPTSSYAPYGVMPGGNQGPLPEPVVVDAIPEPEEELVPPPRPVCPLISFCPNGQLLVMFPSYERPAALSPVLLDESAQETEQGGKGESNMAVDASTPRHVGDGIAQAVALDESLNLSPVEAVASRLARQASLQGVQQVLDGARTTFAQSEADSDDVPEQEPSMAAADNDRVAEADADKGTITSGIAQAFAALDPETASPGPVRFYDVAPLVHQTLLTQLADWTDGAPDALRALRNKSPNALASYCKQLAQQDATMAPLWQLLSACVACNSVPGASYNAVLNTAPELLKAVAEALLADAPSPHLSALTGEAELQAETHAELVGLLARGLKEEALELCVRAQAWSHALLLAAQADGEVYKRTVLQMTAARFAPGSSLETLYAMLVGKTPAPAPAAPPLYDDLDGWAHTLATCLNNATPDVHNVVRHLGDSLLAQHQIAAAQTCYLLLGHVPSLQLIYKDGMRLLGKAPGSTVVLAQDIACIHATEAFAQAQINTYGVQAPLMSALLRVKLATAQLLSECGLGAACLSYCEAVAAEALALGQGGVVGIVQCDVLLEQTTQLAVRIMGMDPGVATTAQTPHVWDQELRELIVSIRTGGASAAATGDTMLADQWDTQTASHQAAELMDAAIEPASTTGLAEGDYYESRAAAAAADQPSEVAESTYAADPYAVSSDQVAAAAAWSQQTTTGEQSSATEQALVTEQPSTVQTDLRASPSMPTATTQEAYSEETWTEVAEGGEISNDPMKKAPWQSAQPEMAFDSPPLPDQPLPTELGAIASTHDSQEAPQSQEEAPPAEPQLFQTATGTAQGALSDPFASFTPVESQTQDPVAASDAPVQLMPSERQGASTYNDQEEESAPAPPVFFQPDAISGLKPTALLAQPGFGPVADPFGMPTSEAIEDRARSNSNSSTRSRSGSMHRYTPQGPSPAPITQPLDQDDEMSASDMPDTKPTSDTSAKPESTKSGGGWLSGLFGGGSKPRAPQVHLDDGSQNLEYSEEHKTWLPTDPKEREEFLAELNKKLAPPPVVKSSQKIKPVNGGQVAPLSDPMMTAARPSERKKGRRRPKYASTPGVSSS
eukprot:TRINITY_DN11853_c0_g1_i3.p1 TRINITY_DN11853_c0_g1~~TRINITY_DN11853_c0_g1_i3.p1  ORF type:complete len:1551 (+),score=459.83 TRINITY_DN11853_c0_g1_i3:295-4653(+)